MLLSSRAAVLAALLLTATAGCAPKCEDIASRALEVCRRPNTGITAGAPFVVQAKTSVRTTCNVTIDGGAIDLSFAPNGCVSSASDKAEIADPTPPPVFLPCEVPVLDAGTYTFTTGKPLTFTLPETPDAAVPLCP